MKVLVCDIGLEREYVGIEESSVKRLSEAKTFSVPWGVEPRQVLEDSGEIHPVVGVKGILGEGEIKIFVILKSGYALGINSVIGYEELDDEIKLPDDLKDYFKAAYRYEDGIVYVLKEESVRKLPKVEVPRAQVSGERPVDHESGQEVLILHVGDKKYAVKVKDLSEIADPSGLNILKVGNLYGFVKSSKGVVAVLSKWKVDPRWIVVLDSVAVPCESFEIVSTNVIEADGREFVIHGDEQISVLSEKDLREWI